MVLPDKPVRTGSYLQAGEYFVRDLSTFSQWLLFQLGQGSAAPHLGQLSTKHWCFISAVR